MLFFWGWKKGVETGYMPAALISPCPIVISSPSVKVVVVGLSTAWQLYSKRPAAGHNSAAAEIALHWVPSSPVLPKFLVEIKTL